MSDPISIPSLSIEPAPKRRPDGGHRPPPWLRVVREVAKVPVPGSRVRSPDDVASLLGPLLGAEEVERFLALLLDSQSRVRGIVEVSRGILNASLVHPREVFRVAVIFGAAGVILVHNHPSGDPTPSPEDKAVTRQLVAAGELLDLPVYDHVIIAGQRTFSFATAGLI